MHADRLAILTRVPLAAVGLAAALALVACGGAGTKAPPAVVHTSQTQTLLTAVGAIPTMTLESAFPDNGLFSGEYTCSGLNTSPPLHWTAAPAAAKAFVVLMDDPDAGGTFQHWVIYNVPAAATGFLTAVPTVTTFDDGTQQGLNSAGKIGYTGPCPPRGALHHYRIFLYALDTLLPPDTGVTKREVTNAMNGHIIARGMLTATYLGQ